MAAPEQVPHAPHGEPGAHSWRILHLTDLHLGPRPEHYVDDGKRLTPEAFRTNIIRSLLEVLERAPQFRNPDAIVVSGDITTRGNPRGLETFLMEVAPRLHRLLDQRRSNQPGSCRDCTHDRREALCVVPGNHDVAWNLNTDSPDLFDAKFRDFRAHLPSGSTTCLFPTGGIRNGEVEFDDRIEPVLVDESRKLVVLCINSAIRCGEVDQDRRETVRSKISFISQAVDQLSEGASPALLGEAARAKGELNALEQRAEAETVDDIAHVTQPQRIRLARHIEAAKERTSDWSACLKVATLHHHLVPFKDQVEEHKAYEPVTDSSWVLGLLATHGFDLVLTGHKHQPYAQTWNGVTVLGGPTVGGDTSAAPGSDQGIRWIEASRTAGRISVRVSTIPLYGAETAPELRVREALSQSVHIPADRPQLGPFPTIHRLADLHEEFERVLDSATSAKFFSPTLRLLTEQRAEIALEALLRRQGSRVEATINSSDAGTQLRWSTPERYQECVAQLRTRASRFRNFLLFESPIPFPYSLYLAGAQGIHVPFPVYTRARHEGLIRFSRFSLPTLDLHMRRLLAHEVAEFCMMRRPVGIPAKASAANLVVVTGGPCSGKTSVIHALADRGHQVVPEAALDVIDELMLLLGPEQAAWRREYYESAQALIAERQFLAEQSAATSARPFVFLDRGLVDCVAYCRLGAEENRRPLDLPPNLVDYLGMSIPYLKVFLLDVLPNFDERRESGRSSDESRARRAGQIIEEEYRRRNVPITTLPGSLSVDDRVEMILKDLGCSPSP